MVSKDDLVMPTLASIRDMDTAMKVVDPTVMRISGGGGFADLAKVEAMMLSVGEFYISATAGYNDEGEQVLQSDIVLIVEDAVPGSTKRLKMVKSIKNVDGSQLKRISQLPGTSFYGPIAFNLEVK